MTAYAESGRAVAGDGRTAVLLAIAAIVMAIALFSLGIGPIRIPADRVAAALTEFARGAAPTDNADALVDVQVRLPRPACSLSSPSAVPWRSGRSCFSTNR